MSGTGVRVEMSIGGRGVAGSRLIEVHNPATGEIVGTAPDASAEDLDLAVDAARRAFPAWSALSLAERQRTVGAMAAAFAEHVSELKALLTAEQGKPLAAAEIDVLGGAYHCQMSAQLILPVVVHEGSDAVHSETHRVPIGVVAAIAPWNVPVSLAFWKVAPALVAGNTVILKPSPFTPLTTLRIGEILRDILPPGVLNVISGGDALGPMLTAHPGIEKISFTGSTATGRKVMESASPTLKRLTLELGGNDAAIVLPGVDVEYAAGKLFNAAFGNSGQICVATKRLFVHAAVYDRFAKALLAHVNAAKVGNGTDPDTRFGPIQNRPQFDRIRSLLDDCQREGHAFLAGGTVAEGAGLFVPLTVVDNPPRKSRIVQEEQFGPILPLLRFEDIDDVVREANDTAFGLGASVWGPEADAVAVAQRLEAGTVWVNDIHVVLPGQPFGGHKQSGIGVENGLPGLLEYTLTRTIVTSRQTAAALQA